MSESIILLLVFTYFLGAIPFGLLFAKWMTGKDPREHGSGNIGATNAMRTGGKKVGICTLLADVIKGVVPVALALHWGFSELVVSSVALVAFLGHVFPVYLKFKGGKGVATMFGVLIPWLPWVAVLSFVVWLLAFKITRYVSFASVLAGLVLPVLAWSLESGVPALGLCMSLGLIMTARHYENIKRLLAGTESKVGSSA